MTMAVVEVLGRIDSADACQVTYLGQRDPRFALIAEPRSFVGLPAGIREAVAEWMRRTDFGHVVDEGLLAVLSRWRLTGRDSLLLDGLGAVVAADLGPEVAASLPGIRSRIEAIAPDLVEPETPRVFDLKRLHLRRTIATIAVLPLVVEAEPMTAVVVKLAGSAGSLPTAPIAGTSPLSGP